MSDVTVTLSSLVKDLQPRLNQLEVVDQVFADGIKTCTACDTASQRAAHLLSTLYDSLLLCDSMGQPDNDTVGLTGNAIFAARVAKRAKVMFSQTSVCSTSGGWHQMHHGIGDMVITPLIRPGHTTPWSPPPLVRPGHTPPPYGHHPFPQLVRPGHTTSPWSDLVTPPSQELRSIAGGTHPTGIHSCNVVVLEMYVN